MPSKKWQKQQQRWQSAEEQAATMYTGSRGRGRGRGRGGGGSYGSRPFDLATYADLQVKGSSSSSAAPSRTSKPQHPNAHLRVKAQQAMPFDYSTLRTHAARPPLRDIPVTPHARRPPPSSDSDSDIVLTPPKHYVHTIKPHLERGYAEENQLHHVRVEPKEAEVALDLPSSTTRTTIASASTSTRAPHTRTALGLGARKGGEAVTARVPPSSGAYRPLRVPLTFVRAQGEWKDGGWTRFDAGAQESTAAQDTHDAQAVEELLGADAGEAQRMLGQLDIADEEPRTDALAEDIVQEGGDEEEVIMIPPLAHTASTQSHDNGSPSPARSTASSQDEPSFVIDLAGDDHAGASLRPGQRIGLERSVLQPASEPHPHTHTAPRAPSPADSSSEEPINWTRRQPRGAGKKARNAAKKARRRERRAEEGAEREGATRARQERDWKDVLGGGGGGAKERREGSDIEWGSEADEAMHGEDLGDAQGAEAQALRLAVEESLRSHAVQQDDEGAHEEPRVDTAAHPPPAREDYTALFAPARTKGRAGTRAAVDQDILDDYIANALVARGDDDADEAQDDHAALLSFVRSMDAYAGTARVDPQDLAAEETLLEMERAREAREEIEWETESESEAGESTAESGQESIDEAMRSDEQHFLGHGDVAGVLQLDLSDDESSSDDDDESGSDSDHSPDEGMFRGGRNVWVNGKTKHDDDEDVIDRIEAFATANFDGLTGPDRKARKRLFKAIERGDFMAVDDLALPFEDDVDEYEARRKASSRKTKSSMPKGDANDIWAAEFQSQWEKDRSKKAAKKRAREEARLAAALSNTPGAFLPSKGGKTKGGKKGRKSAAAALDAAFSDAGGVPSGVTPEDAWYFRPAMNLHHLDRQLSRFCRDEGRAALTGPKIGKEDQSAVRHLARSWGLKMHVPHKGKFSAVVVVKGLFDPKLLGKRDAVLGRYDARRGWCDVMGQRAKLPSHEIDDVLARDLEHGFGFLANVAAAGRSSYPSKHAKSAGKKKPSAAAKRSGTAGAVAPKNRDGTQVGFGAEPIAEENVGHRLLTMMGWAAGSGLGTEQMQGRLEPVGATVKISRGGLGW